MRRTTLTCLLLSLCTTAALAAAPAKPAAPIELGESRPVETKLGNPALPAAAQVWTDMINSATSTLDLEHFYLSHLPGGSLQPVLDAVGRAAARGVRVRLLLDAAMSKTYPQPADSLGGLPNVLLRRVDYRRLAGGVQHAKFMIVDGREAWLGSQNMDWRAMDQIHEMGVRMREPQLVLAAAAIFETDWLGADTTQAFTVARASGKQWPVTVQQPNGAVRAWFGASPPKTTPLDIPWDRDLIVERIQAAKSEICVQVLQYGIKSYGTTDSTLHRALLAAGERGVKVRLIVSDWSLGGSNEPVLREMSTHRNIEIRVSRVPHWSAGYVPFGRVEHCKFMVADAHWLWVGTSNWEPSYFSNTRNVGLTVEDARLAGQARQSFETSWNAPSAIVLTRAAVIAPRDHREKGPAGMKVIGN